MIEAYLASPNWRNGWLTFLSPYKQGEREQMRPITRRVSDF